MNQWYKIYFIGLLVKHYVHDGTCCCTPRVFIQECTLMIETLFPPQKQLLLRLYEFLSLIPVNYNMFWNQTITRVFYELFRFRVVAVTSYCSVKDNSTENEMWTLRRHSYKLKWPELIRDIVLSLYEKFRIIHCDTIT